MTTAIWKDARRQTQHDADTQTHKHDNKEQRSVKTAKPQNHRTENKPIVNPNEQQKITLDDHDDDGVSPWVVLGATGLRRAEPRVPALTPQGLAAAHRTEAVASIPAIISANIMDHGAKKPQQS